MVQELHPVTFYDRPVEDAVKKGVADFRPVPRYRDIPDVVKSGPTAAAAELKRRAHEAAAAQAEQINAAQSPTVTVECVHPEDGVWWNDVNQAVQCHRCGHVVAWGADMTPEEVAERKSLVEAAVAAAAAARRADPEDVAVEALTDDSEDIAVVILSDDPPPWEQPANSGAAPD